MASIGMRVVTGMATVLRRDCGGGVGGGNPENGGWYERNEWGILESRN